jgi:4-phospho-D-threonate 3-dehydrogenase / 4-phospho-D-erythronate 3-dehydrogenase
MPTDAEPSPESRPTIALSMGDPLGIGPEVLVRALAEPSVRARARFVIHGWSPALLPACEALSVEPFWWRVPSGSPDEHASVVHDVLLMEPPASECPASADAFLETEPGPTREGGVLSVGFVERCVQEVTRTDARRAEAIVTAPIAKASWALAGKRKYPGHTELLAARSGAKRFRMVFESDALRVALATAHIPLMELRNVLTIGRVAETIDLAHEFCRDLGVERPRVGVCGLNPHAGEEGLLGDEDERIILPAIRTAQQAGIDATGPFPADTVYTGARRDVPGAPARHDIIVAMYHDQGLIPVKLLAFDNAVNCTAGLPFVRTSPDHGTAWDIARRFVASPGSMSRAITLAVDLATRRLQSSKRTH